MKKIVLLLAFAAGLAAAVPANAGYCTTTCTGFGNTRTCNTWCY